MSSRRRPPADLAAVKKSRASYTGAITRALDKIRAIPATLAEEVLAIKSKDLDRILSSLERTEAGFLTTLEDAQGFAPEGEEEEPAFQMEEDLAMEGFQNNISIARDLANELLTLKAVLNGLNNFKNDLDAMQDSLAEKPDSNHSNAYTALEALFTPLRDQWQAADLDKEHPIKAELDSCKKALLTLGADVASARDRSDSHSSTPSTSTSSANASPCCGSRSRNDLPTIDVPIFKGGIMEWSTFWASFKSTIEDRMELSNTQRLHYLRQAVKDPDLQLLLYSPTETPDMYLEVVQELKSRFNKTREIHRHLTKSLLELPSPKQNRVDLRRLADTVKRTVDSLKATKHYDVDSLLTSLVYLILPSRLQTLWDQHTKKEKGVLPVNQILTFIRDHAETLLSTPAAPHQPQQSAEAPRKIPRRSDRKPEHPQKKGNIHVVTPSPSYRWECSLCRPEKHPLHLCPSLKQFPDTCLMNAQSPGGESGSSFKMWCRATLT